MLVPAHRPGTPFGLPSVAREDSHPGLPLSLLRSAAGDRRQRLRRLSIAQSAGYQPGPKTFSAVDFARARINAAPVRNIPDGATILYRSPKDPWTAASKTTYRKRRTGSTGQRFDDWLAAMRPIPVTARTSCRRFISNYGEAWRCSIIAAPSGPG